MTAQPNESPFIELNQRNNTLFFPVAERPIAWARRDGTFDRMTTHKAIVRLSEDARSAYPINVVNTTYKLVPNKELFNSIETMMHDELGTLACTGVRVKDHIAHGGRTCIREYVFPNIKCRPTGRSIKSDIAFRTIMRNSYGGSAIRMFAGAIEAYCTNGMILGQHDVAYFRHTSGLQLADINLNIKRALAVFANKQEVWATWANAQVEREKTMEFFQAISESPRQFDLFQSRWLEEREDRGATLWSVYSTLTNFSSHADGEFAPRRSSEDTLAMTMLNREVQVQKWIESPEWSRLEWSTFESTKEAV